MAPSFYVTAAVLVSGIAVVFVHDCLSEPVLA